MKLCETIFDKLETIKKEVEKNILVDIYKILFIFVN